MRQARKTVALRPGATGYTPPSTPASNPCLNCGTNVQLHYCPECGQPAIDPDPTLREFLAELAQEFLNWDGKLFTTFRLLLTRPGALTQEYLVGRRSSYLSPLRLYLTCSVLFFFVSAVMPRPPQVVKPGDKVETQLGPVTVESSDALAIGRYLDSTTRSTNRITRAWGGKLTNVLHHGPEFTAALRESLPRVMFVLVPLFAALVGLVFRARRMRYPQHLAFALHVHAFMFVALLPTLSQGYIRSDGVNVLLATICIVAIVWYLVQAVRPVYATTLRGALVRSAAISGVYALAYALAVVITLGLLIILRF